MLKSLTPRYLVTVTVALIAIYADNKWIPDHHWFSGCLTGLAIVATYMSGERERKDAPLDPLFDHEQEERRPIDWYRMGVWCACVLLCVAVWTGVWLLIRHSITGAW